MISYGRLFCVMGNYSILFCTETTHSCAAKNATARVRSPCYGIREDAMKRVLADELKYNIRNFRFAAGVLMIIVVALASEHAMFQKIIDANSSPEGPGWFAAYSYCMNSVNTLLFVPIAAAFAGGENAEAELHSRFSLFRCIRAGKREYLLGKAAGLLLSGGLMVFLAMTILLGFCVLRFGRIPPLTEGTYHAAELFCRTGLSFLRLSLNGAFWTLVGGTAAVVTKNRYMAFAVPFILYYDLTVFQERYYQKLFFLSPRYWAASIYYSDGFCICVLLAGTFLMALLLMGAIKRRLEHG